MKLTIERMSYGFDAISHDAQGKTVFVAGAVPGDTVEARLVSDGGSFSRAELESVLEPSPWRIASECPYAKECGGCPWSFMTYGAQLEAKASNVEQSLKRIGHFDDEFLAGVLRPIVPSDEQWGYRNKIELAVEAGRHTGIALGMHRRSGAGVVRIDACKLLPKPLQKLPRSVGGALRYLASSRELGLQRVGIRCSTRTRQTEVALWTDAQAFPRQAAAKILTDAVKPNSVSRVLVKDPAARKIAGLERLAGKGYWNERIHGNGMQLSAPSFFQVNTAAAEKLIDLVLEGLDIQPDDVACDLYCGAGTFTIPLAKTAQGGVIAVESYGPAVRDLRRNIEKHQLDGSVECIGDDAARVADVTAGADVLVVDPPRAGLAAEVVEALDSCPARRVAYVSCDPATLARDLKRIQERGAYRLLSVTPVDLFPQTFHVECVSVLERAGQ